MDEQSECLVPVDFDSRAFGFPFYRVVRFNEQKLRAELAAVAEGRPMAADCKVPADDVGTSHGLMGLGFRKICMQVELRHDLRALPAAESSEAGIADHLDLDDDTVWAHARNFTRDRFSLDPLLPAAGRHRLYRQWFRNSLGGAKQVAYIGPDVCTFTQKDGALIIDLVSVLEPRRGHGSLLLTAVLEHARRSNASSVIVKTECENTAAWNLYQRKGFVPVSYTAVFHLVRMP